MKSIIIHIHSFVDLITNSSSEIFISATDKTLNSIIEIIADLTGRPCDELFDVELVYEGGQYVYTDDDEEISLDDDTPISSPEGKKFAKLYEESDECGHSPKICVKITAKNDSLEHKNAAEKLMGLIGTYNIYEKSNY